MSVTFVRYQARCPGCGREERDSSEEYIREAADAHEDECDALTADEKVEVAEVDPNDD